MNTPPPEPSLPSPTPSHQTTLQLKLDWRVISALLLAVIGIMLWLWQPWRAKEPAKTITVRGQATIEHAPDSFRFQPVYQDADSKNLTATGNDVVAHLKTLGIKDADIKADVSSSAQDKSIPLGSSGGVGSSTTLPIRPVPTPTSTYIITITASNRALAQKVADYLATTPATGQLTPLVDFSPGTRAKLDLEARAKAADDAKAKAAVLAKQLGGKLGRVVKISEDAGYGILPLEGKSVDASIPTTTSGPTIQPGTNEVAYGFAVVFELK